MAATMEDFLEAVVTAKFYSSSSYSYYYSQTVDVDAEEDAANLNKYLQTEHGANHALKLYILFILLSNTTF